MKYLFAIAALLLSSLSLAQAPVLIDVRTAEEYAEGHAEGALLIPHETIAEGIARLQPGKDTPIYVYCRSGRRSGIASRQLRALGYTQVTNLETLENARRNAPQLQP